MARSNYRPHDSKAFASTYRDKLRWLWERREQWWDLISHHQVEMKRLVRAARQAGLYSRTTYSVDIASSLFTHIRYLKTIGVNRAEATFGKQAERSLTELPSASLSLRRTRRQTLRGEAALKLGAFVAVSDYNIIARADHDTGEVLVLDSGKALLVGLTQIEAMSDGEGVFAEIRAWSTYCSDRPEWAFREAYKATLRDLATVTLAFTKGDSDENQDCKETFIGKS